MHLFYLPNIQIFSLPALIGLRTFSIYLIESFRKVVTMTNCGSQLVHMRDCNVDSCLNILEKLGNWFHRNNYIMLEIKMAVIKEWGDKVEKVLK